jgi:hypothetical protein
MPQRALRDAIVAAATAAVLLGIYAAAGRTPAQMTAADRIPRGSDGNPRLDGIWQANNSAHYDLEPHPPRPAVATVKDRVSDVPAAPVLALGAFGAIPAGLGVVEGNAIPYTPDALKKKQENFAHALTRDPAAKCYMPGVPRATYMPFPFQIITSTSTIAIVYEFAGASRTIHMGKVSPAPLSTWMGQSVGHWDGDTLVVEVTDMMPDTWFDRAGNHHTDKLKVTERYTPLDANRLQYDATIEDPGAFTRPWKISMPLYRRAERDAQIFEFKCAEFVEELLYGYLRKEQVVTSWEEDLGQFGGTLRFDVTRGPSKAEQ